MAFSLSPSLSLFLPSPPSYSLSNTSILLSFRSLTLLPSSPLKFSPLQKPPQLNHCLKASTFKRQGWIFFIFFFFICFIFFVPSCPKNLARLRHRSACQELSSHTGCVPINISPLHSCFSFKYLLCAFTLFCQPFSVCKEHTWATNSEYIS